MKLTENQLRMLLAFYTDTEKTLRYAQFSRDSGIPKYEVSRVGKQLAAAELITENAEGRPVLTEKGNYEAKAMFKKVESARAHMIYEGVPTEDVEKNALVWAMSCTNSLFDAIDRIDEHYRTKSYFDAGTSFTGYDLCRKIGEGFYTLPFVFYKMEQTASSSHTNISMASGGFYKTCEVIVHNGAGKVILTPVAITSDKTKDGRIVTGKAAKMSYWNGEEYVKASMRNEKIMIPMDSFTFMNMGEDIASRVLHGSIEIKVDCSGGGMEHEMSAMFTLFLH